MTFKIAIATIDPDMDKILRLHLLGAGEKQEIPRALADPDEVSVWMDAGQTHLLVVDAQNLNLEQDPELNLGMMGVFRAVRAHDGSTPVLFIVETREDGETIEETLGTGLGNSLMLPMNKLQAYRQQVIIPFLRILTGIPEPNAVLGGFRLIEIVVHTDKVECRLGTTVKEPALLWHTVNKRKMQALQKVAQEYEFAEALAEQVDAARRIGTKPLQNWLARSKQAGTALFREFVIEPIGKHLFSQMERAAGGLEGLSFRFVLNDASFFAAPFEASVRAEENGPFVLLYSPVVRRLEPQVRIRETPPSARMERGAKVLFVRSQVAEQDWVEYEGKYFEPLPHIEIEKNYLSEIEGIHFSYVDLLDVPPGEASKCLLATIDDIKPDILHYAGHTMNLRVRTPSQKNVTLILPGETPRNAMGLPLEKIANSEGLRRTKLVYLSTCRGISVDSSEQLVRYGIPYTLGFRWNVEDKRAADFAKVFYHELEKTQSICLAFRMACFESWRQLDYDDQSPIWISPILIAQSSDWAHRL